MILPDIPRLYTALAEILGAVLYAQAVPHRKAGVLGHYGGLRRTAGDVPLPDRRCTAALVDTLHGGAAQRAGGDG